MVKIVQIIGTRPQFIKYFPIYRAIGEFNHLSRSKIKSVLIHTGQHYDYAMSEVFFKEFKIHAPSYFLAVGSSNHGEQTGQILRRSEKALLKEKPDAVMVYGDTNSTLGAALAAVKLHIPVIHIEAGLRSYNRYMPEEINRILVDHCSTVLLCPSKTAVRNLRDKGFRNIVNNGKLISDKFDLSHLAINFNNPLVLNVGDAMYDVLLYALEIASKKSSILKDLNLNPREYITLTIHRAENTDDHKKLKEIIGFVNDISGNNTVIFPMHPRSKKIFKRLNKSLLRKLKVIEPLGYFDMAWLVKNSKLLLTDSGGLQKEAYWLGVPCVTLREQTEWTETIQSGWNVLYRDYRGIHNSSKNAKYLYGDGKAAKRIVNILKLLNH